MAPEQARGERVDARADVFSFGVVLSEMLSGKRPLARTERGAAAGGERTIGARLDEAAPDAPPRLLRIVERCLAVDRAARFADGSELLEALRAPDLAEPMRRARGRRFTAMAAGAALAVAAAAGALALGLSSRGSGAPGPGSTSASTWAASSSSPSPPSALLAIASAPIPLTTAGLCSSFPVFADDGSLVFTRQEEDRVEIHRIDLATATDTALTDDHADSLRPTRGGPGRIIYMFQHKGGEGGSEVRAVAVAGGTPTTLGRGSDPVVAAGALFFLHADGRVIRRRDPGGNEDVLYESPSSSLFNSLAVSPDARWLATNETTAALQLATPVCIAYLGENRTPLDCSSAGRMTSSRPEFAPHEAAVYFARGESIVRFDLASHATEAVPVSPAPTTLAIAPDGASLVYSTCRVGYEVERVEPDGRTTSLPGVTGVVGLMNVGPRGELAFPVAHDGRSALGITDPAGASVRVMTSDDHMVTEVAFSPDGRRVAFHDATPGTGGLFVADVDGSNEPSRVTTDADDSLPAWLDAEHVVYMHPEKGLPFGRAHAVAAAGGEPRALPKLPGVLLGTVPARRALLLAIRSPSGDHFAEAALDGRTHDIAVRGVPPGLHWEIATAASPSGRYVAWYSGGAAWRADLEAGTAQRVDFPWPRGDADAIQPDDLGRLTVSFRYSEGQLYRVTGTFR
jgi:hypothetical protein